MVMDTKYLESKDWSRFTAWFCHEMFLISLLLFIKCHLSYIFSLYSVCNFKELRYFFICDRPLLYGMGSSNNKQQHLTGVNLIFDQR